MDNNGGGGAVAGGIMKDEIPYSPAVAKSVILAWAAAPTAYGSFFPEGSIDPARSHASPKIWEDAAGFQAELDKFKADTAAARRPPARRPGRQGSLRRGDAAGLRQLQDLPRGLPHRRTEAAGCGGSSSGSSRSLLVGARRLLAADHAARAVRRPSWRRCRPATPRAARPGSGPAAAPPATPPRRPRATSGSKLGGGQGLKTAFGNFVVPNISSDPADGIGGWTAGDLANAMLRGVSPGGRHLYPAFPYASYARMKPQDIADLRAYLATLPAVAGPAPGHELCGSRSVRRGLGLWKLAFLDSGPAVDARRAPTRRSRAGSTWSRGRATAANATRRATSPARSTSPLARRRAGNPEGKGRVPNITGGEGGIGDWSAEDIAYFFETGFTPDFDSVGGSMVEVQENMAMLAGDDRAAIAAYLKAVPPQASAR